MKLANTLTILSCLIGCASAGTVELAKATTLQEVKEAAKSVALGAAVSFVTYSIPFAVPGFIAENAIPMLVADNEDGSRSCWLKVLDSNDITDREAYEYYVKMGLPIEEFLKHASISVYPPGYPSRYVARNRKGQRFRMRQTVDNEEYKMFHMEEMPKMITWHPEEEEDI